MQSSPIVGSILNALYPTFSHTNSRHSCSQMSPCSRNMLRHGLESSINLREFERASRVRNTSMADTIVIRRLGCNVSWFRSIGKHGMGLHWPQELVSTAFVRNANISMNGSLNWRNYDLCGDVNDKTLIVAFVVHDHLMRSTLSDSSDRPRIPMATVAPSQPSSSSGSPRALPRHWRRSTEGSSRPVGALPLGHASTRRWCRDWERTRPWRSRASRASGFASS